MTDTQRADELRAALREVIDMLEQARSGDAWIDSIAARVQRAEDDPAAIRELADLIFEGVVAGLWLAELARAPVPAAEASEPGWPWILMREMADKIPDSELDPGSSR